MSVDDQTNDTGTQELREAVRKMINDRPYYICKSGNGDHKDLQSQIGSMIGQYSRREDKLNEEYLEREIIALINTRIAAVLDKAQLDINGHLTLAKPDPKWGRNRQYGFEEGLKYAQAIVRQELSAPNKRIDKEISNEQNS